jgi:hypothetical protein
MSAAESTMPAYVAADRYVTVSLFSSICGLSANAIRMKMKEGKWLEGREWVRSPDGGIFIDRQGVQKWISRGN